MTRPALIPENRWFMLRQPLAHRGFGAEPGFRWRSREIARVEGFTDAVFAFAIGFALLLRVHLPDGALRLPIESHQWDELMIIYGIGYMALFGTLFLLYHHAWRRRESLELNAAERHDTRTSLQEFALNMGVALASIVIVLVGGPSWSIFAGFTYGLIGPIMATHGGLRGRARRRLEAPPS